MRRPFTLKSVFRKSTSAHILSVDARDLCRRRWQSSHATEFVRSWHPSAADMVAPFLAIETCRHVLHDSSSGAIRPPDTPDCRAAPDELIQSLEGRGLMSTAVRFEGETSRSEEPVDGHGPVLDAHEAIPDHDGRLLGAARKTIKCSGGGIKYMQG